MPDALSDVLQNVRLRGAIFFLIDAGAPWAAAAESSSKLAPRVLPGAQHVIEFHALTRGSCFGGIAGGEMQRLEAGDVIAFPQGDAHVLASAAGLAPVFTELPPQPPTALPIRLRQGGTGDPVQLICGFIGCDALPFNPLLSALPRVVVVRGAGSARLKPLLDLAVAESAQRREGSDRILTGLSELLFVEVVREYVATLGEHQTGWLAGLRDEVVGRALEAIHGRATEAWTLDSLARVAGASRSVLAERFSQLLGTSPISYLTSWRMQLASTLLSTGESKVAAVAAAVGYESEAAFSRAFKRHVGTSPSTFRR